MAILLSLMQIGEVEIAMDALEYEKTRVRMCRTMIYKEGGCGACPIYNVLKRRCGLTVPVTNDVGDDYCKKTVSAVEDWAKEHPIKTRQSEFLKMFPKAPKDGHILDICPQYLNVEYMPPKRCENIACGDCRIAYWSEEVPE